MSKPLNRLTTMRPQTQNPNMPAYAPERDISFMGYALIENMRICFQTGRFDGWYPTLQRIIPVEDGLTAEQQREAITEKVVAAGKRFAAFVRASLIRDQALPVEEQQTIMATDFRTAYEQFLADCPEASFFVAAMQGYMFMDALFFCTRQAMLAGEETNLPIAEFLSLVSRIGNGWRMGEADADICAREMRQSVELLLSAGFNGNQIREVVDSAIAKCMSSRM